MKTRTPRTVNMHQAKTNLSELVEQATQGVPIVLARSGQPVARIVPIEKAPLGSRPAALGREQKIEAAFLERSLAPLDQEDLEQWENSAIYPLAATEPSSSGGLAAANLLFVCLLLAHSQSGNETILAQGQPTTTPEQAFDSLMEVFHKTVSEHQTLALSRQIKHLRHVFVGPLPGQGSVIKALDGGLSVGMIQVSLASNHSIRKAH